MNIKLKEEYYDTTIYLPIERRNVLGKFIDVELYGYLQNKYPEYFEEVKELKEEKEPSVLTTKIKK